jgi:hypothetical protein
MNTKPEPNHDHNDHLDHDDKRQQTMDPKPDPDHDRDDHHDNDNDAVQRAVAPAPTAGALAALAKLTADLNKVNTAAVLGRSGHPMLQFKSRDNSGTWMFGQRKTIPEEGSLWAVNPTSFQHGWIVFGADRKKPLDDRLVSVSQPRPDLTTLPDHGFQWSEQWAVGMKCISGADAGTEVIFKTNTIGGTQAVVGLLEEVRTRLNGGQHAGKVSPIVRLEKYSYPHPEHGRTWNPQMTIVDWMAMDGPAPAPAPEPTPEPEPRRRRVG